MKKTLKFAGMLLGILVLIIAVVALWVNFSSPRLYPTQEIAVKIPTDSAALFRGMQIAEQICAYCHRGETNALTGRMLMQPESAFGEMWSANITNHPDALGKYTDGEIAYLLRTGIQKDGRLNPFMLFPNLTDEDLGAVIAYLRSDNASTTPSPVKQKSPNYSFLAKALFKLGAIKPFPYKSEPIVAPPKNDKVAYGKYLATSVFVCAECHSQSFETFDYADPEKSPGFFGGGNPVEDRDFVIFPSRNLTPHPTDGIGSWNLDQFSKAVRSGLRPDGTGLSNAMPRFLLLQDEEIEAIWEYLKTVPPIGNEALAKG